MNTARALTLVHLAVMIWLTNCASMSSDRSDIRYTVLFLVAALTAGIAAAREYDRADQARGKALQAKATARYEAMVQEDTVRGALDKACCERWWTAIGTDHDPTCPNQQRKEAA